MAELPEPTTQLPRGKPLPKPRAPTKWEIFAQRKGITKHKRSKDVWDEEAGEYKRRFGYKRAGDESEVPIIEASASDQVGSDSAQEGPWDDTSGLRFLTLVLATFRRCSRFWLTRFSRRWYAWTDTASKSLDQ